jgi:hypothetical protein
MTKDNISSLAAGGRLIERAGDAPGGVTRPRLAADATQANKVLAKLKIEKAKIYGDRKVAAADQPRRN